MTAHDGPCGYRRCAGNAVYGLSGNLPILPALPRGSVTQSNWYSLCPKTTNTALNSALSGDQ
ncbi:MAG: hypothetical protein QOH97_1501 [Actinoplanes sp.]|jgi:hypothetical protein|nr:hypothetical protein [Actinoplanes sp.]